MKRKKSFIETVRQNLLKEKSELENKTYQHNSIDMDGDEIDTASGNLLLSIDKELSARDVNKLRRINIALKKIEKNIYGICEDCGEEIAEKRLEFSPYIAYCVDCVEEQERMNKSIRARN